MVWIPPISLSESAKEIYQKSKSKEGRKDLRRKLLLFTAAAPIGIFIGLGILYSFGKMSYGTWNYKKWPEIREQQRLQKELRIENEGRNYSQKYDLNKNGILDSTEFLNYYNKKKK